MRRALLAAPMALEIVGCRSKDRWIVAEVSDPEIAAVAQQSADPPRVVTVIYVCAVAPATSETRATNRTSTALRVEHLQVFTLRDAIAESALVDSVVCSTLGLVACKAYVRRTTTDVDSAFGNHSARRIANPE
jgi:hypothetical protein